MNWVSPLLIAWLGAAALMLAMWLLQRRTGNAGVVDAAWAFGIGACVVLLALNAPGDVSRRWIIALMTGFWSLRLGGYLVRRIRRDPEEDGRYQALREWAGARAQPVLLAFFQVQAFWVVLFALPQFVAMHNRLPLGVFDLLAAAVFAVSITGELIADRQLERFRRDPANRGRTCRSGLWRYSRHPNYFFEWLHWFAYPLMALGAGWIAWVAALGPLMMLYFLLKVTGIPPTEARALKTRGDDYRDYQRSTSAFFPWFPRTERASVHPA